MLNEIEGGAPADIFISAAVNQINTLDSEGKLVSGSINNIVTNTLVLIAPTTPPVSDGSASLSSFGDLTNDNITGIAIGDPTIVPAGNYATQVFDNLGITDAIQPKLVLASNVRNVLAAVENQNISGQTIDAGVVYLTDALTATSSVRVVDIALTGQTDPIVYPLGILASTSVPDEAQAFSNYLTSGDAQSIFQGFGFGGSS